MKNITAAIFFLLLASISSFAQEEKDLPDFSETFPEEKLWSQTKIEDIETFSYGTNLSFEEIRKKFLEFLGDDWKEIEIDEEGQKEIDKMLNENEMDLDGNILFANESFPGVQVGLSQMEMNLMGKKYFVNVTVIKNME